MLLFQMIKIDLIKCLATNGGINGMIIGQAIDCYFENQRLELNQLEFYIFIKQRD